MITIDECCHLLTMDLVSGLYLPELYLEIPEIYNLIQMYHWNIFASDAEGWIYVQRRMVYKD